MTLTPISVLLMSISGGVVCAAALWGLSRRHFRIPASASVLSSLGVLVNVIAVVFTHPTSDSLTSIGTVLLFLAAARYVRDAEEEKRADKEFKDRMDQQLPR